MPDSKSGLEQRSLGGTVAIAILMFAILPGLVHSDDWKVEARGVAMVQTNMSGGAPEDTGKFKPGLKIGVTVPLVFGVAKPKAPFQVTSEISILDFPQGEGSTTAGAKPAALFSAGIERQVGRAKLAGEEPKQRVAATIGTEIGYSSFLGAGKAGKWAMGTVSVIEERDGLEVKAGIGVAELTPGKWPLSGRLSLMIPIRRVGSWFVVGADAFISENDTVSVWIGGRMK